MFNTFKPARLFVLRAECPSASLSNKLLISCTIKLIQINKTIFKGQRYMSLFNLIQQHSHFIPIFVKLQFYK